MSAPTYRFRCLIEPWGKPDPEDGSDHAYADELLVAAITVDDHGNIASCILLDARQLSVNPERDLLEAVRDQITYQLEHHS